jgi:large subunit ribosomal protein L9
MKVILTQNVPKLGAVGDVCQVAPGFGRNYLVPQGMAIVATPGALKQIDDLKRTEQRRQARLRSEGEQFADRINALHLTFTARVGETGRLYGSITASDIAEAIEAQLGEPVDRHKILLDESIRTLGEHEVAIHLMPGVDARAKLVVVAAEEVVQEVARAASEEATEGVKADALEQDATLEGALEEEAADPSTEDRSAAE